MSVAAACITLLIVMPALCGVASWWSCRLEHRQHRRDMDAREAVVTVRERQAYEVERRLGQRAHDFNVMTHMRQSAILDDTTIMQVLDWSEPA